MIVHRPPPTLRLSHSTTSPFPRPPKPSINVPCRRLRSISPAAVDSFTEKSGYLFELTASEADSLTYYDVSRISAIYRRRPLMLLRRLFQIGSTFGLWFALRYLDGLMDRSDQLFEVRAEELRKILVELGPTAESMIWPWMCISALMLLGRKWFRLFMCCLNLAYVKVAQAISSRPDLIPPSYLDELSLLQDRIAPFSTDIAFHTIEKELKSPLDEVFMEISPEPVAAASLGQVYQARLRRGGKIVAVKVQRPGVQAAISLDILILRYLAGIVKRVRNLNTDLQAVIDEWASSLFREMDYENEAQNGIKFRQLYGGIQDVMVPEMYMEYTTQRVLTMEWIKGQKLSEVKDLYLVEVGVYCSFNQLLEFGFYHADPHPGNLLRTYDGKLAYLDFGMMGEFKQELRDGFIEACLHLVNSDFVALAKDFVTLGLLPPTADKEAVTVALTSVFQNAVAKGVSNISFGDLLGDLGVTMYKFKFQIPSYFSLVIRSLAVLEGIAISFNPNYKVLGSTYPWIARKVLSDSSPKLRSSLQELLYEDGTFRIDRLESLLTESLRARTEKAALVKKADDRDNRMVVKQVLSFTLTEKGTFVRGVILEELAKGLDALGLATVDSISSVAASNLPFQGPYSSSLTDEDRKNLRILQRLSRLMSGSISNESLSTEYRRPQREANVALDQLYSVQEIVPLVSTISELPPEAQQQLLRLPGDLAGRLLSRVAARTIRRIFS